MGHPTYLYREGFAPTIFDSDNVPKLLAEGWCDSPYKTSEDASEKLHIEDSVIQDVAAIKKRGRKVKDGDGT